LWTYKFRSANVSVDILMVDDVSVGETYFSDHPLTPAGEPPNDIVRAILRTNVPRAQWFEMNAAPFGADYALRSSDQKYVAILRYKGPQLEDALWTMTVALRQHLADILPPRIASVAPVKPSPVMPSGPTPAPSPVPLEPSKRQEYEAAIADLTKRIEKNPNDADALVERGFKYTFIDDYEKAVADYEAALKIRPNNHGIEQRLRSAKAMLALGSVPVKSATPGRESAAMRSLAGIVALICVTIFFVVGLTKAFRRKTLYWRIVAACGAVLVGIACMVFTAAWQGEFHFAFSNLRAKLARQLTANVGERKPKLLPPIHLNSSPKPAAKTVPSPPRRKLSPAEIVHHAFPSSVLLTMLDAHGQTLCLGSGFFVAKNVVATNSHVVSQASAGYAKLVGQSAKLGIKGIIAFDPLHDLALIEVESSDAPSLQVAAKPSLEIGDPVYVIGNPLGLEATFSPGIVSGFREIGQVRVMQMTAPISPGSSGGPVLDESGKVVGVSVFTILSGQNLNFAIPSEYVAALENRKTELRSLRSIPQPERRNTLFGQLGSEPPRSGVDGENLTYDSVSVPSGNFSFSIRNRLTTDVSKVFGVVIFYDIRGAPIDSYPINYPYVIPAGGAIRVEGRVATSVERLNCPDHPFPYLSNPPRRPKGRVEFRILDFTVQ
jgi:S1-C subfamily serine protease